MAQLPPSPVGSAPESCRNCDAPLAGEYCARCGQRRLRDGDRRLRHLLGQFVEVLTDLDGRFWRSLRALILQPGRLSRDYVEGRRARWLSPATLFVLANVVYFLAPALTDFSLPFYNQVPGHLAVASFGDPGALSPGARERMESWGGQIHSPVTAAWVERRIERRDAQRRQRSEGMAGYTVADYAREYDSAMSEVSKVLIVLHVPFLALGLWALFPRSRLYFAEHFVVGLHLFAALVLFIEVSIGPMALLARVIGGGWFVAIWDWWRVIGLAVLLLYVTVALRRVYDVAVLRAIASALVALLVLATTSLVVYRSVQFLVVFALT